MIQMLALRCTNNGTVNQELVEDLIDNNYNGFLMVAKSITVSHLWIMIASFVSLFRALLTHRIAVSGAFALHTRGPTDIRQYLLLFRMHTLVSNGHATKSNEKSNNDVIVYGLRAANNTIGESVAAVRCHKKWENVIYAFAESLSRVIRVREIISRELRVFATLPQALHPELNSFLRFHEWLSSQLQVTNGWMACDLLAV